ncbi:MAG: class IV adenylate cyclase [Anaerohalosphaeraceae bacterium]|nr:class IV adenylate cyclase [Anaerohalosphaeraceae bacterium]
MEIEIKLKVENFDSAIAKLKSCDADFVGDFLQVDSYYDDPQDSLVNSDRCLRIRKHICDSQETIELTYKGKRENHRFKTRREIGLKVEKAEELAEIFAGLDYEVRLVFEKKRSIWNIDNCEVALDELPFLGEFIEIEGPDDETITNLQNKLGLAELVHNPKSYAHLMEDKLKQLGIKDREVTFELALKI